MKNTKWPKISVITPSYNQGQFLEECIDSILVQGYPNLEYIIMDGGSSDNSVEIIKKYEKYLSYWQSQPDGGQYAAIQEGLRRSTGEIMTWLNSDDRFYRYTFGLIGLLYAQRPEVEWTMGLYSIIYQAKHSTEVNIIPFAWSRQKYLNKQYKFPFIQQEGSFWRRSLWERSGACLRTDLDLAGDLELWMRFFRHAQLYSLKFPTASYRIHGNQKAQLNLDKYFEEAELVLDEEIARYRQGQFTNLPPAPAPIGLNDLALDFAEVCEACYYADELLRQGESYFEAGQTASAQRIFKRLLEVKPDDPATLNNLGVIAHLDGREAEAAELFGRALKNNPLERDAILNLAELLNAQNRPVEALELVDGYIAKCPDDAEISALRQQLGGSARPISDYEPSAPLVSVIVPTLNRPADLRQAILSIQAQSMSDFEIIVVNDGGVSVAELIAELNSAGRISYLEHAATRGMSAARNTALKAARGRYIAYLDDDDIFYPEHLATLTRAIQGGRVAYSDARMAIQDLAGETYHTRQTSVPYSIDFSRDLLLVHNIAPILSFLHERSLLEEAGYFDENLDSQEDWDLWLRLAELTDFVHVKQTTAEFRRRTDRSSVTSRRNPDFLKSTRAIYARYTAGTNPVVAELRRQRLSQLEAKFAAQTNYLITAVVSTYNAENLIGGCLADLENQTIADKLEIIVVDSGSQQNEAAIVQEFQQRYSNIKYIRTAERETVYEAWNRGFKSASGRYLTNANTDDRHRPDALEKLVAALEQNPDKALAYADVKITRQADISFEDCLSDEYYNWPDFDRPSLLNFCYIGPQPVWRASLHAEIGWFDEGYRACSDYDFWLRAADQHDFIHLREPLGLYLLDDNTVSMKGEIPLKEAEAIKQIYHQKYQGEARWGLNAASRGRILFVAHSFPPEYWAGVETYTLEMAQRLKAEGFAVAVCHPVHRQGLTGVSCEQSVFEGLTVYRLLGANLTELESQIVNPPFEDCFGAVLSQFKPDIVHFEHFMGLPLNLPQLARANGAQVCVTLHDHNLICLRNHLYIEEKGELCSGPETPAKCARCLLGESSVSPQQFDLVTRAVELKLKRASEVLNAAASVAAPSRYLAETIKRHLKLARAIEVLPLGLDPSALPVAPARAKPVIAFLGQIHPIKNPLLLLEAFEAVSERAELQFWGWGSLTEELKARIRGQANISYCGAYRPEQLPAILAGCDVVAVPSRMESYSLVAREALSAGVPVIAASVGGIPEAVIHEVNGLLIAPDDLEGLKKALLRVVDEPGLLARLKSGIRPLPTRSEHAQDWTTRYAELLNQNNDGYLVSAIVSTYNAERFLRDCLNDLENQTIAGKLEIIVVDSGSQQNEAAIVNEFQQRHTNIKYIRTETRETVYQAWNRGVKAASGRYLTNANTDDRHRADAFEIMARTLDHRPDIDLVYANVYVSQTECPSFAPTTKLVRPPEFSLTSMVEGCFMGPQPMWRKTAHARLGYFNEAYISSGDYEFWCRMAFKGGCQLMHLDENLGVYYQNPSGVENSDLGLSKQEAQIIRQCYLDYHRRQQGAPLADIVLCDISDAAALERSVTTLVNNTAAAFRLLIELDNPPAEVLLYLKRHAVLFDGLTKAEPALEGYLNPVEPSAPLNLRWPAGACAVHADWLERLSATFASHPEKDRLGLNPGATDGREFFTATSAVVAQRRAFYGQPMPSEVEVVGGIRYGEAAAKFSTNKLSSIIILTYNQLDYTRLCLDSVLKYTDTPYEIILVDNASTDGTVKFLEKFAEGRPNVRLILNATNTGFGHGNNQALEVAQGDYIVFLNNDVVVTQDWLGHMIRHLEFGRGVGLVGPRSNSVAGSQLVQPVPYTESLAEMQAYAQSFYAQHQGLARETIRLVGFCLLASRQLIDLIGGFDENYGSGNYEDDDLCLRSYVAGFRHLIAEDVFVHHYGSQTFIGNRIDHSGMLNVNRAYFERKWAGLVRFIQQGELVSYSLTEAAYDKTTRLNLLVQWGEEAFGAGNLRRAIKLFKFVLEIEPTNQAALNNLGVMQWQLDEPAAAAEIFAKVLRLNPANQDALDNFIAVSETGAVTVAAELLNELIARHPERPELKRLKPGQA